MKKLNITKRDIWFFVAGLVFMLVIMIIVDIEEFVPGFKEGYNSVRKTELHKK